jgi:hypothetical protein
VEKTLDDRILEATNELEVLKAQLPTHRGGGTPTRDRIHARAEKRLADLISVREGRAVEVYATVSVDGIARWVAHGESFYGATCEDTLSHLVHAPGDRLTILRGVACLPVQDTVETEAESEEP